MSCKSRKSFGLIETLIACAVLMIIAGAVLTINVVLNNNIQFTKERAYATYRATGAIETVRNIRDTNYIDSNSDTQWNSFICDLFNQKIISPDITKNDNLKFRIVNNCNIPGYGDRIFLSEQADLWAGIKPSSDGMEYDIYLSFEPSGINPEIKNGDTDENSVKVIATVEWSSRGQDHKVEVKEILTNWKQLL
jgi:hypothetical protein